jgi:hypothetical protein
MEPQSSTQTLSLVQPQWLLNKSMVVLKCRDPLRTDHNHLKDRFTRYTLSKVTTSFKKDFYKSFIYIANTLQLFSHVERSRAANVLMMTPHKMLNL